MKAVIPLAGKGTRLRPHTHLLPKPLVRVAGRPVLAHLLDDLVRFGITEMVFIVGHLDEVIRRYALLFEGIDQVLASAPGPSGEYYLTDAYQYMVDRGARIRTAPVDSWHDCGSPEGLLGTNRHLLEVGGAAVSPGARLSECSVAELVLVEDDVVAQGSVLGPNVTLERGAWVADSRLSNTIVGASARVEGASLDGSLVGAGAVLRGVKGRVSVSDHSVVEGREANSRVPRQR